MVRFAYPAVIVGAVLIGFSPIFVRLSEVGPVATAFYRVFLAVPFFALLLRWDEKEPKRQNRLVRLFRRSWREHLLLFLVSLIFSFNQIFWHFSLQYTYVANATLLANLSALFVIPLGWFFFGLRMRFLFVFYAFCSFVGVAMLLSASVGDPSLIKGDLLAIGAAIFYAFYQLILSSLRRTYSMAEQMFWTTAWTSVILLPFVWLFGDQLLLMTLYGFIIVFCLSFFCHFLGQGAISFALGHISPNLVSLSLLIQPVTAAVLGLIIFAELLGWLQLCGIVITLFFLYFARRVSS